MFYLCREKNKTLFGQIRPYFIPYAKETQTETQRKQLVAAIFWYVGNMRFVCVFEANHACVCAGQSKTGSIVKAFETLNPANIYIYIYIPVVPHKAVAEVSRIGHL